MTNLKAKLKTSNEENKVDAEKLFKENLFHKTTDILQSIRKKISEEGFCKGKIKETSFHNSSTFSTFINKKHYNLEPYKNLLTSFDLSNNKEDSHNRKLKAYIIAGEHAREMISVELLFYFIEFLCDGSEVAQ